MYKLLPLLLTFTLFSCTDEFDKYNDQSGEFIGNWIKTMAITNHTTSNPDTTFYGDRLEVHFVEHGTWQVYFNERSQVQYKVWDYFIEQDQLYRGSAKYHSYENPYTFSRKGDTVELYNDYLKHVAVRYDSNTLPESWPTVIDTIDMDSIILEKQ